MNEESLLHDALAKPPFERTAFLDAACAGKPELRAAVLTLLASHGDSGGFGDPAPGDPGATVESAHRSRAAPSPQSSTRNPIRG